MFPNTSDALGVLNDEKCTIWKVNQPTCCEWRPPLPASMVGEEVDVTHVGKVLLLWKL